MQNHLPNSGQGGQAVALELERGYASLTREWQAGEVLELRLPMPVRRVVAQAQLDADRGKVALQRGPLVYCAEQPDNPGGSVRHLLLPDDTPLTAQLAPALLGGVTAITGRVLSRAQDEGGGTLETEQDFTAIP